MFARRGLQILNKAGRQGGSFSRNRTISTAASPASRKFLYGAVGVVAATATAASFYKFNKKEEIGTSYVALAADKVPLVGIPGTKKERTFIAIKPDGVQRGLIGEIIKRFEDKGFKLVAMKELTSTEAMAAKHYEDLKAKAFYPGLVKYFASGPIVAMVWEGKSVIKGGRKIIGATNPQDAEPGSIRGDLCIVVGRNIIHGSDSPEAANAEISLWFKDAEVSNYDLALDKWINED